MATAKNKKLLTVAGIAAGAATIWYFLFRTRAGASVTSQVQETVYKMFDLEPSYGTPEYKKFTDQLSRTALIVERVLNQDTQNRIMGQDLVEAGTIISTRLTRNYKDLERANDNTIAALVRQDSAYQKMLATYKRTGKLWAGGSADIG